MKETHLVAMDKKTGIAKMRLFNVIDGDGYALTLFNDEFDSLLNDTSVKEIEILINSRGGSVFDGLPIYNAISQSSKPVTTIIDSIGASIGAIIALAGKKRKMYAHGQMMVHSAYVPDSPESSDDPVVKNTNATLFDILKKVSKKTKAVVQGWLSKDTWFNANEALAAGLIDEIVPTTIHAGFIPAFQSKVQNIVALAGDGSEINNLKNKYASMIEIINELKLDEAATEETIIAKIKDVQNQVADLQVQLTIKDAELVNRETVIAELTNKVSVFEQTEKDKVKNEINALVESAFTDKKINAQGKDVWRAILTTDLENGKKALNNLVKPEKISETINSEGNTPEPTFEFSPIQQMMKY